MSEITQMPGEITGDSQFGTINFMKGMADTLGSLTNGSQGDIPSLKNIVNAASG